MTTWRRLLVLGVVLACAVPVSAQTVTLRHKFTLNELTLYRMQATGQGTVGLSGLPGRDQMAIPLQMGMTMDSRQRVIGVDPQGVATLRNVVDGMAMNGAMTLEDQPMTMEMVMDQTQQRMKINGEEMAQPPEAAAAVKQANVFGKPFLSRMDSRGRILEISLPETLKQAASGFDFSAFYKSGQSTQFLLPAKPVSVGETWQDTMKMPVPGMGAPLEMRVASQLLSVAQDAAGRTIATIQQTASFNADNLTFSLPMPGAQDAGMSLHFDRLRETIAGPILWSVDEGKLVRMDMNISVDVAASMPIPLPDAQGEVQTQQVQFFGTFQGTASMLRK